MPNIGPTEVIILVVLLLLLFGAKRLPDTARGLGRSMRIFKAETKGLRDEDLHADDRDYDDLRRERQERPDRDDRGRGDTRPREVTARAVDDRDDRDGRSSRDDRDAGDGREAARAPVERDRTDRR